jgi:hypothetical protein
MSCDPISPPAAVGDCLTDWTISSALPMPYNGGRVAHVPRASLADEGRCALREMAPAKLSEQKNKAPHCHYRVITKPKSISLQLAAPENRSMGHPS